MKKIFLLSALFTFLSSPLSAQNWSAYPIGKSVVYFTDTSDFIYRMALDSVYHSPDSSTYFQEPGIEFYDFPDTALCYGTGKGNMLVGSRHIVTDSLIIFHFERVRIPLPIYRDSISFSFNNDTLTAIRTAKKDSLINGVSDSIMSFKILGSPNRPGPRTQYAELILSKSNGLLEHQLGILRSAGSGVFNFTSYGFGNKVLRRSQKPSLDIAKIFDLNVGDQFQYTTTYYASNLSPQINLENWEIISKIIDSNSYTYNVLIQWWDQFQGFTNSYQFITYPKVYDMIDSSSVVLDTSGNFFDVSARNWEGTNWEYIKRIEGPVRIPAWSECIIASDPYQASEKHYAENLGIICIANGSRDFSGSTVSIRKLTFYKKGTTTWGTKLPLDFQISIPEKEAYSLELYPTLSSGLINFDSPRSQSFSIYNINGKLIKSGTTIRGLNYLNLSDLPKGAFIIQLEDGASGRFFKL